MKWNPTKEQPGRYSWMLEEIAKMEGVSTTYRRKFKSIQDAQKAKYKLTDMIFTINTIEQKCVKCQIKKGGIKTLFFDGFELPFDDYNGMVFVEVTKTIDYYNTKPEPAGDYKNCEGGGWYSMANLYKLNGIYYTDAY